MVNGFFTPLPSCPTHFLLQVVDVDGEEPVTCLVTAVTAANPAAVTVHEENRHNLEDGQKVPVRVTTSGRMAETNKIQVRNSRLFPPEGFDLRQHRVGSGSGLLRCFYLVAFFLSCLLLQFFNIHIHIAFR